MPSFTAPAASGSAAPDQRTREAAQGFPAWFSGSVIFNPPRFHSAVPNPGVQWTRCARH